MSRPRKRCNAERRRTLKGLLAVPFLPLAITTLAARRGIVGQAAPELHAAFWIDATGQRTQFSLTAQRGRWVHIKCWQSWCPGCHSHGFPALQRMVEAFDGEPRVVNVAVQTVFEGHGVNTGDRVRETQLQYDLPIHFGHDPGRGQAHDRPRTMRDYRTGGTPWHILVNPDGMVVADGFSLNTDVAITHIEADLART